MNMFKPSEARTVESYLSSVPEERKDMMNTLHELIQKTAPTLKPHFASNMLGYGSFPYRNYKKEEIEWPVISLANQKNYVSLYVCSIIDGKYVAEEHAKDLGKVKVGKSCISFKKLEDIDLPTLKKIIKLAENNPGFGPLDTTKIKK